MGLLNAVVSLALRRRGIVIALGLLALAYGVFSLTRARYDVFPEFAPPEVSIETDATGLAPEQVEQLVTQPVENVLNGVPGVLTMRSQSIRGVSNITMTFDPGGDIFRDRQLVAERLAGVAAELPQGVGPPRLTPLLSSTGDALIVGLTSKTATLMEQRTLADWVLRPHLLAVSGVANVAVFGGDVRQIQIQLDPEEIAPAPELHHPVGSPRAVRRRRAQGSPQRDWGRGSRVHRNDKPAAPRADIGAGDFARIACGHGHPVEQRRHGHAR